MTHNRIDDDAMLISSVLKRVADDAPRRRALPEARYFWLTSQVIPSRINEERALQPLGLLQGVAHAVLAVCWALVIMWKFDTVRGWFSSPDIGERIADAVIGAGTVPLSSLAMVGGLLCITSVVILHSVIAEE